MAVIYIRDVPDETVEQLRELARRNHTSLQALALAELSSVARRANNAKLLAALPDLDIATTTVVQSVVQERPNR